MVGLEVMKSHIDWDIMPCSPLKVNLRFGGTRRLHLHGRIGQAKNQHETGSPPITFSSSSASPLAD
jgi:hypothetical protein